MRKKHVVQIIGLFGLLGALVTAGCHHHRTSEARAENIVQHLTSALQLNAAQTAKLESMKQEFLARRPEMEKMRQESFADLKAMMLSPQIDKARLAARTKKIQEHADELVGFVMDRFAELHDLLTPAQRSKLVEDLDKHMKRCHRW